MSYILDALKKSEQERGHGTVPGVQTIHSSSLNYHREKRSVWPWFLVALIIINLIAVAYFIRTEDTKDFIASTHPEETNVYIDTQEEPVISAAVNTAAATQLQQPIQKQAPISEVQPTQQAKYVEPAVNTVDLYDLPLSVRQHIPAMKFSAHVYSSNPLQRSLVINNRFMEEGSQVSDELILTEITSDGAVFDFQGYSFSTSILSGWD